MYSMNQYKIWVSWKIYDHVRHTRMILSQSESQWKWSSGSSLFSFSIYDLLLSTCERPSLTSKPPPSLIIMCSYYCQETTILIALTSLLLIAHNLSSGNAVLSLIKSSFKTFKMLAKVTITPLHKNATCSAANTQKLFNQIFIVRFFFSRFYYIMTKICKIYTSFLNGIPT